MRQTEEIEKCEIVETHPEIVKAVNEQMPQEEILYVLFESEMCVCDIAQILQMSQSAISHQLRVLKQNHLVKFRREGKSVLYSLSDDHVRRIINQGLEHVEE